MRRRKLKHLFQDDADNTCGQTCVAMLTGRPRGDVIALMGKSYTTTLNVHNALRRFGFKTPSRLKRFSKSGDYANYKELDVDAVLKLVTRHHRRGTHHWVVWDAKAKKPLDPMEDPYLVPPAKITSYLPILSCRAQMR